MLRHHPTTEAAGQATHESRIPPTDRAMTQRPPVTEPVATSVERLWPPDHPLVLPPTTRDRPTKPGIVVRLHAVIASDYWLP